jgi:hypothetical protein
MIQILIFCCIVLIIGESIKLYWKFKDKKFNYK